MFKKEFVFTCLDEAASVMRSAVPEVRKLFAQVEILLRLLIVVPATSCEAERSFSSLRRLKTWLRSTMSQNRLNNVAVCNVHQRYIDNIDIRSLVNEFVSANDRREEKNFSENVDNFDYNHYKSTFTLMFDALYLYIIL